MRRWTGIVLAVAVASWAGVAGAAGRLAVDRGHLSLAWEAHDEGLCGETLVHLAEIRPGSPLAPEAMSLEADCLYELGRYRDALGALSTPAGRQVPDRAGFVVDVVWDWAWRATVAGSFEEARQAVAAGQRLAGPEDPYLRALAEMVAYRGRVAADLAAGGGDLASHGPSRPPGTGWVRAAPWDGRGRWIPDAFPDEWLPGRESGSRALWLRVDLAELRGAVAVAAARLGLRLEARGPDWSLVGPGAWSVDLDPAELQFRGALEGFGADGAAWLAAARAAGQLAGMEVLATWVEHNAGSLSVSRSDGVLWLEHPRTGRRLALDPSAWWDGFDPPDGAWAGFWSDLVAELGRPPRPYRCFCGREVVLREVPTREPGDAVVVERSGDAVAVVLAALCPEHVRYVTAALLEEWGVGVRDVLERARADRESRPWALTFRRGEAAGAPYLVLNGDGVATLARDPSMLLGALQAVDGRAAGGRAVRVVAPTPSVLVVLPDGPAGAAAERAATTRALRGAWSPPGGLERIDYRVRVRLPDGRGLGVFRVRGEAP